MKNSKNTRRTKNGFWCLHYRFSSEGNGVKHFRLIDFDGYNLGLIDAFNETRLDFDSFDDARDVAIWWDTWINGADI